MSGAAARLIAPRVRSSRGSRGSISFLPSSTQARHAHRRYKVTSSRGLGGRELGSQGGLSVMFLLYIYPLLHTRTFTFRVFLGRLVGRYIPVRRRLSLVYACVTIPSRPSSSSTGFTSMPLAMEPRLAHSLLRRPSAQSEVASPPRVRSCKHPSIPASSSSDGVA